MDQMTLCNVQGDARGDKRTENERPAVPLGSMERFSNSQFNRDSFSWLPSASPSPMAVFSNNSRKRTLLQLSSSYLKDISAANELLDVCSPVSRKPTLCYNHFIVWKQQRIYI